MSQQIKRILLAVAVVCAAGSASAFSMQGPYADWQIARIGYNPLNTDVGAPMNLGEEYRWNTPNVYYGFDESFLNYFGAAGTNAVDQALAILNALPKFSQMSSNLSEFPTDTVRENSRASALGLVDLKTYTLAAMMEQMGLASPERYTWTLRNRIDDPLTYTIIKRNFDPVTLAPSSFVNGTLYTFVVREFVDPDFADAVEVQFDPLQFGFTSVADGVDGLFSGLFFGQYYTGLTRDDVGGLRYLYRTNNYQFETLLAGTTDAGSGSPWDPIGGGGNAGQTNASPDLAVRPGVNKINFIKGKYDSLVGSFITTTNVYTATYVTNSTLKTQNVQRVLTQPDILFAAGDLGVNDGGAPIIFTRTGTDGWANNDAINGQVALDGPGVIQPQVTLTYSKVGPYFFDQAPQFLEELILPVGGAVWGSFDGTTNDPIIYPSGTSIYDYEQQVQFGGGGGAGGSAWVPNSLIITTNTP